MIPSPGPWVSMAADPTSSIMPCSTSSRVVAPQHTPWKGELKVIFQTIPGLHEALGQNYGDWYFSGDYPTPGGFAVVNQAFIRCLIAGRLRRR